ncbi:MAG: ABC transporter ATP-binding protein [Clostridia bacterium]|nr:ABC transporter ATP-binding protein [Clostridia bacterium]
MFNKELLKEMFYFTTNTKRTIKRGIIGFFAAIPYLILYQYVLSKVIDQYIPDKNVKMAVLLSFVLIAYIIIRFCLDLYMETERKIIYYDNDRQIKNKVFDSIQDADISELDKIQVGNLFNLTTTQSFESSQMFVWNVIGIFAVRLRSIVVISIIMLFINWKIALVVIGIFIVSYIILMPFYNKNMKTYKKLQYSIIDLQGKINEYIDSFSTTKTLRLEEINMNDIKSMLERAKNELIKSSKILGLHTALFALLTFGAVIATLIIGGNQIVLGIGVGSTIMLIVDYISDINNHMNSLLEHVHGVINKYNCFINVLTIVSIAKEKDEGTLSLEKIDSIEFENVTLSYDGVNTILDQINLKIDKRATIAIVGKSGAGKTSLVNLIPRFYNLTEGRILINGIDYTKYKLSELRKNISYVFQNPTILNMSIKENLMYGNENVSFQDVIKVCKEIGLNEKIESFTQGYDTIINAETDILSYGEKQLLSFARAILKNGSIVILDEVTSNLDLEFERNVMEANKAILKDKISFVIAHRINTVKDADLIILIENKKNVEMGKHEDLIQKHGYYYNLYMSKETTNS